MRTLSLIHIWLFEKQTEYFENKQNVFVWDAPSHALSRPFTNNYGLSDIDAYKRQSYTDDLGKIGVIVGEVAGILEQPELERPEKSKSVPKDNSVTLEDVYKRQALCI